MADFFSNKLMRPALRAQIEEALARVCPPSGYEGHTITEVGPYLVWKLPSEMGPNDPIVFFDGDCRDVLKPDDPRLARYTKSA